MIIRAVRTLLRLLPLTLVVLIGFEFIAINELAGLGDKLAVIDQKIEDVAKENELILQQVASASSLLIIEQKAHELGFAKGNQSLTISPDEFSVALGKEE